MKFRFHRGSLEESMQTLVHPKDIGDLIQIIEMWTKYWYLEKLKVTGIELTNRFYDKRIDWDGWLVVCRFETMGDRGYPVGFVDLELNDE